MKGVVHRVARWSSVAVIIVAFHLAASNATAQSWTYQSYDQVGSSFAGYITLEEKDGVGILTMTAPRLDLCYQGDLKVTVTKTDATTVITLVPHLNCPEVRFVINNDGTGGRREVKRGEDWVWDRTDRRLTPRK